MIQQVNLISLINTNKINKRLSIPSFRSNDDWSDKFEKNMTKYDNSREICDLVEKKEFEVLKNRLVKLTEEGMKSDYYTVEFKDKKATHIFAVLCKAHSELKAGLFSKNKANRDLLELIAKELVKMKDFDPNALAFEKGVISLFDYVIECKNEKFASILLQSIENWKEDTQILKWILMNKKAIPSLTSIAEFYLKDSLNAKTEENNSKYNPPNIAKYKVQQSKYTPISLNEVGGMYEAKKAASEFIIKPWQPKYRNKILKNNIQMPNGFMLYGPPGCGKTYLAMAIANEMDIPMYQINLAQLGSSLAHETEKGLSILFNTLEKKYEETREPSLLFLDELDSICANRESMHTDWKRDYVNTILQLTNNASEKGIILIGATNFIKGLDPAILRTGRFDKKIEISLPTEDERKDILTHLFNNKPMAKYIQNNIPKIAKMTDNRTCSDINAIIQTALRTAVFDNKDYVELNDIEKAINALNFDSGKSNRTIGYI